MPEEIYNCVFWNDNRYVITYEPVDPKAIEIRFKDFFSFTLDEYGVYKEIIVKKENNYYKACNSIKFQIVCL